MKRKSMTVDPRSAEVVLRYGGEGFLAGVPACDLTQADIARIAYVRAVAAGGSPNPEAPEPAACEAIVAELIGSGLYSTAGEEPVEQPEV